MATNSDLINPVLEGIVANASNIFTEDRANTNIQSTPNTMSAPTPTPPMNEDDILIQQLQEEKRNLQVQIDEIGEAREVSTEKQIYLRNLRAKKLEITRELRIALEKKCEEKYEKAYKKKLEDRKSKIEEEINSIFGETTDDMKPTKENKTKFARNFNMFGKYRDTINELREDIKHLMKRDTSEMTT